MRTWKKENATLLTEFILTGLVYQPEWQIPLFLLFLMIYLITILGNLGLIALIYNDPHLHVPMYLFVTQEPGFCGCLDIIHSDVPSCWSISLKEAKMMSLTECKIQFFLCSQCNQNVFCWQQWHMIAMWPYANHYFTQLL